jgi:hypothetical protein
MAKSNSTFSGYYNFGETASGQVFVVRSDKSGYGLSVSFVGVPAPTLPPDDEDGGELVAA